MFNVINDRNVNICVIKVITPKPAIIYEECFENIRAIMIRLLGCILQQRESTMISNIPLKCFWYYNAQPTVWMKI
uniref:Uncharacterized protein n=1 Tax=Strongyloides papillosus TaxID=174720 RepID=A0A0N5C853_STREA